MLVYAENELYPIFYSGLELVWLRKNRKLSCTDPRCMDGTTRVRWAQEMVVGVRVHPGCGSTLASPARHRLAPVGSWLGLDLFYVGARPKFGGWMGLCLTPWCMICITLSLMAYFDYNSIVFQYKSCKTYFF